MRTLLVVLALAVAAMALDDMTYNNTYVTGQVLMASDLNEDNDSTRLPYNRLLDTLDAKYVRFADLEGGDTLMDSLRVTRAKVGWMDLDSLRGAPNVDSLAGAIRFTGATLTVEGLIDVDTIQQDTLTITGMLECDTIVGTLVSTGRFTSADVVATDSVIGATVYGARTTGSDVVAADSVIGAYVRGTTRVTSPDVQATDSVIGATVRGTTRVTSPDVQASDSVIGVTVRGTTVVSGTRVIGADVAATDSVIGVTVRGTTAVSGAAVLTDTLKSSGATNLNIKTNGTTRITVNSAGDSLKLTNVTTLAGTATDFKVNSVVSDSLVQGKIFAISPPSGISGDAIALTNAGVLALPAGSNTSRQKITTYGGAARDTITNITGAVDGQILILQTQYDDKDVFFCTGGEFYIPSYDSLSHGLNLMVLMYDANASQWFHLFTSRNQ